MRGALVVLALLAAGPALAKPKGAATAAPAASAAPATPAKVDRKKRDEAFAEVQSQLDAGQLPRAADALVALVDDPARAAFHAEAYARLGELLAKRDLPYAALLSYARAFELSDDASAEVVGVHVPAAIALADKVGDTAVLQAPFAKNLGLARTDDVRGRMAYMAAREAFRTQSYGLALGMLKMVAKGDPLNAEARLLEGIVLNQQDRPNDALAPLDAAAKASGSKDRDFKDLVAINTARSFYAAGNFPRALQGYAAVDRASKLWPEAQFERAWAHFRIDDMNGTLSALVTLEQPFFDEWYWPEADLLRIYGSFMMCKFTASNDDLEAFKARYAPIDKEMAAFAGKSPEEAFAAVRTFVEKGDSGKLPRMLLRPWAAEDKFLASLAAVRSVEGELARMKNASANPFTERAHDWLQARRDALVKAEGARVLARVAAQQQDIHGKLGDAEIFGLDILRMQTQLYEMAAASGGKLPNAARVVKRDERTRRGWQEWPYEGEAWADELGYYKVVATPECPLNLRRE